MKTTIENLAPIAQQMGILLMTAAATLGMFELPDHARNKIVVPNQPAFATVSNIDNELANNPIRREKEDSAPHYISYSENQRTPGRSGKF